MPLTDIQIKQAKPTDKPYKMADGRGLYILIHPNGSKYWQLKFRQKIAYETLGPDAETTVEVITKEKIVSFGMHPDVTIKSAREMAEIARKDIKAGIDPVQKRKKAKLANAVALGQQFEVVAEAYLDHRRGAIAETHLERMAAQLRNDCIPYLKGMAVSAVTKKEILAILKRIENRGAVASARRTRSVLKLVFEYACDHHMIERNPVLDVNISALKTPTKGHFAAITEPGDVPGLLRKIDTYPGKFVTRQALRLFPLVFSRPGEIRRLLWSDIDLDRAEWRYFVTKTKKHHLVPLSRQAVEILRETKELTGGGKLVFPCATDDKVPLSENTLNNAIRRMGYNKDQMTSHGFRAMARTIIAEELGERPDVIEHQLAHVVADSLGTAYNRTKFINERRRMMQHWADWLDRARTGGDPLGNVVPIKVAG